MIIIGDVSACPGDHAIPQAVVRQALCLLEEITVLFWCKVYLLGQI